MAPTLGDLVSSKSKEVDPIFSEVSIFKQLIKERKEPLDLVRELLSNSGAREVGAKNIEISYTKDKEGHIFEIQDDGCGMDYSGKVDIPLRLDRFLGLGLSGIIGKEADEFSWKGLGSKLAYQSRRVEIETSPGGNQPLMEVRINEPWETINNNKLPRPRITEHPPEGRHFTKIRVVGHPPHRLEQPFSFQEIKTFLFHRTFAGFTRRRELEPRITLSVLGTVEDLGFGFPEFRGIDFDNFPLSGLKLDESNDTLFINVGPKSSKQKQVRIKGFITWDAYKFGLSSDNLNIGLILSVKGIPYFSLSMEEYGSSIIRTARPGEKKVCLILECDWIQDDMNISRSGLVDSPNSLELKRVATEIFHQIETSPEFLTFRTIPEKGKVEIQSGILAEQKKLIEQKDQMWVVYQDIANEKPPVVLLREPKNEQEVNAIIWKMEAIGALPFAEFRSLAYIGASKGPDMLANFLEEKSGEPNRAAVIEVEHNFYNYKTHGHAPSQYPKVICWDIPQSGRKAKIVKTQKAYKWTFSTTDYQVHIYVIKNMPGIRVMSRDEMEEKGITV
jgi:hypothetical protein